MAFPAWLDHLTASARKVFVVVPGAGAVVDDSGQPVILKGLRASGTGSVTIKTIDNAVAVVHPVLDGELIPARITHVTAMNGVTGLIGYA